MGTRVSVNFDDGTSTEVDLRPALMVQAERHFKGAVPPLEGVLWCCWRHLKPGPTFDVWLDTVDNFDRIPDEGGDAPLGGEPSPDT